MVELESMDGRRVQRQARAILLRRIREDWPPGTALAPLRELSRDLGVAYGTLRGAVRSLADAGYLVCKPRQGIFVAPRAQAPDARLHVAASPPAGRLAALAGKTIDILMSPDGDDFVPQMVSAFERQVCEAGGRTRTRLVPVDPDRPQQIHETHHADLNSSDADAAVAFNLDVPVTPRPGRPLVVVTTAINHDVRALQGYDVVTVDQNHGSMLAAEALREAGCKRPAFLGVARPSAGTLVWSPTSTARYQAFQAAWGRQPVPMIHRGAYSVRLGALAVGEFMQLSPACDGLFAASDELAVGFLLGADAQGLLADRPPAVVGFDGQQRARSLNFGRFATVAVATDQMGIAAADLLATRLLDPSLTVRRVMVGCSLLRIARAVSKTDAADNQP